jgi:hypothetical protein
MGEAKRRRDAAGTSMEEGFKDYANRARKVIRDISDVEVGEGWMRGEMLNATDEDMLVLHPLGEAPKRSDNELKIWIRYKDQRFVAVLPSASLDQMVSDWKGVMKQLPRVKDPRGQTRTFLMNWLLLNKQIDTPATKNHSGAIMAAAMVWLHFTGQIESLMRAAVGRGGKVEIGYDITDLPGDKNYNWRTVFYPVEL